MISWNWEIMPMWVAAVMTEWMPVSTQRLFTITNGLRSWTRVIFGSLRHLTFRARGGMRHAVTASAHGRSSEREKRGKSSSCLTHIMTTREKKHEGIHH